MIIRRVRGADVSQPDTRIVSKEGNNKVSTLTGGSISGHEGHISAGRVVEIQGCAGAVVSVASSEDKEVVTIICQ